MTTSPKPEFPKALSGLEREVMAIIWSVGASTAEQVRHQLKANGRTLKDSTVRTVLRRLEDKGFVGHETEGRTYVYEALVRPQKAAAQAIRQIVDRFCGGSVEELLIGMVDNEVVSEEQINRLAEMISRANRKGEDR